MKCWPGVRVSYASRLHSCVRRYIQLGAFHRGRYVFHDRVLCRLGHARRLLGTPRKHYWAKVFGALCVDSGLRTISMASADSLLRCPVSQQERSEEHTSELQSLMRISYAVFCLTKKQT